MVDVGGYYHFKHNPGQQFLLCYGHSVAGQTENYAYVGMYWTWGKDKDNKKEGPNEGYSPGRLNRPCWVEQALMTTSIRTRCRAPTRPFHDATGLEARRFPAEERASRSKSAFRAVSRLELRL